jgi:asparagine synthase (glutamine-hydrolysing)
MCGIAGFLLREPAWDDGRLDVTIRAMTERLRHRGPDGDGTWCDPTAGIALGHRRLAIIDVSAAGAQPMTSASGRWVVVFNGEIYNFAHLRERAERAGRPAWRGHSDTEVLVETIDRVGVETTASLAEGMFAFAAWDRLERTLWLARDRAGEKPLYWGWHGDALAFASELSAFRALPGPSSRVDVAAATSFLRYGYVPAPWSILSGIGKLPPAHLVRIAASDVAQRSLPAPVRYWDFRRVVAEGVASPRSGDETLEALNDLLVDAIRRQMVSDVPLGAFLSGGVDSSLVVAMMQESASVPVRTFSVGFHDAHFDEAPHARAVAAHLGTDHTECYIGPAEALAVIPRLPLIYDEPFADWSQVPTTLVCQMARRHVTVALSGDAGDELFAGYRRHSIGADLWRRSARIPRAARSVMGRAVTALSPDLIEWLSERGRGLLPRRLARPDLARKLQQVGQVLGAPNLPAFYRGLASLEQAPSRFTGHAEAVSLLAMPAEWPAAGDATGVMMALDFLTYLPDDILVKVDRAAMSASLEVRVPFLDPRVIAFAWTLANPLRIRDGTGKWALRALLDRRVPRLLVDRPKQGFEMPLASWLRGPLRDWADALLAPEAVLRHGLLNSRAVQAEWSAHRAGRRDHHRTLWPLLMLQAWCDNAGAAAG